MLSQLRQWAEVQEQLRLNKMYQGLRLEKEPRPRYVFNALSRHEINKLPGNRKIKSIFVPGHGIKFYRPIFGASPAAYYVKNGGNDGADGLSDGNAWETITKVNATALSAGDIVQFKCGSSWTNARLNAYYGGSIGSPVTYTKYGSGNLPLFVGSAPSPWLAITDFGAASAQAYVTIEYIEIKDYDDEAADGRGIDMKQTTYLVIRYCKIHDMVTLGMELTASDYSEVHDNEVYACGTNGIWNEGDYCDFYNNICYGMGHNGIGMRTANYCTVHHNTCYQNSDPGGGTAGIGLEVECTNNDVYYNLLYEDVHAGVVLNASDNKIYNNLFYDNGDAQLVLCDWVSSAPEDNIVKNNIFYFKAGSRGIYLLDSEDVAWTGLNNTFDYNLYCLEGGPDQDPMVTDTTQEPEKDYTFATWVSEASKEANGMCIDPEFMDAANDNYHLKSTSPCRDAGVDVGLNRDFDGVFVPQGPAPDIGAYEFLGVIRGMRRKETIGLSQRVDLRGLPWGLT